MKKLEKTEPTRELIIEETLLSKITYLCTQVSTKEWSGPLFFKIEGDILDEKSDLIVTADEMLLMSIDTAATTEFDYTSNEDTRIMDLYTEKPELMDYRLGNIHSHNSMSAFFSGTDITELKDGAKVTDLFLMLVVNNKSYTDWVAKIGISAKVEKNVNSTFTFYSGMKKTTKTKVSEIAFFNYDLNVVIKHEPDQRFADIDAQIAEVEKRKAKELANRTNMGFNRNRYGNGYGYGDWRNFNDGYPSTDDIDNIYHKRNSQPVQKELFSRSETVSKLLTYKEVYTLLDLTQVSVDESISIIINNSMNYLEHTQMETNLGSDIDSLLEVYVIEIIDALTELKPLTYTDDDLQARCLEEIASYLGIYKTGNPKFLYDEIKETINELTYVQ